MEWVEVQAKTVEEAVAMAIQELGVATSEDVTVEILQEPKGGFLGVGRQEALVKVTPKPKPTGQRRRRRRSRSRGKGGDQPKTETGGDRGSSRSSRSTGSDSSKERSRSASTPASSGRREQSKTRSSSERRPPAKERKPMKSTSNDTPTASIEEQGDVAKGFIAGLLEALGLEGEVTTRIDGDLLYVDVVGDQTEALVGPKGSTLQALHELTRTVIQRKTFGAPRMRLDVAGYTERRREALGIYARKLADRVVSSGEEVMLEPMNAADRKVVHDAIVEVVGVVSFSEGDEPNRAVVLAPDPDVPRQTPVAGAPDDADGDDAGDDDRGSDDRDDDRDDESDDQPGDDDEE